MTSTNGGRELTTDVVAIGTGGAGLAGACGAVHEGASVIVLEAAAQPGGTTARSGGIWWAPNNSYLRAKGYEDPKPDALKYMARAAYPDLYNANHPTLGLGAYEYGQIETYYDHSGPVTDLLAEMDAVRPAIQTPQGGQLRPYDSFEWEDYYSTLKENKVPVGRGLRPVPSNLNEGIRGGIDLTNQMIVRIKADGNQVLFNHRVDGVYVNERQEVIGVHVATPEGPLTIWARKGVVFGSGGFTHNPELRDEYLRRPIFGGCSVLTNQGILMQVSLQLGVAMTNFEKAWWIQLPVEKAVLNPSEGPDDIFTVPGDSLIMVNRAGQRVGNEKLPYSERSPKLHFGGGTAAEQYPNRVLLMIYDQRTAEYYAGLNPIPPFGEDAFWVVKGETLEDVEQELRRRLDRLAPHTDNLQLDAGFLAGLRATIERYDGFARAGVDEDFHRGETPYELSILRAGAAKPDAQPNPTMHSFSDKGPFYAVILGAGTLDTNGGPKINPHGQILHESGQPIPGLYGAGNAVASADAGVYWAGGTTIGQGLTFGFLGGAHAAKEPDHLTGSQERRLVLGSNATLRSTAK